MKSLIIIFSLFFSFNLVAQRITLESSPIILSTASSKEGHSTQKEIRKTVEQGRDAHRPHNQLNQRLHVQRKANQGLNNPSSKIRKEKEFFEKGTTKGTYLVKMNLKAYNSSKEELEIPTGATIKMIKKKSKKYKIEYKGQQLSVDRIFYLAERT